MVSFDSLTFYLTFSLSQTGIFQRPCFLLQVEQYCVWMRLGCNVQGEPLRHQGGVRDGMESRRFLYFPLWDRNIKKFQF